MPTFTGPHTDETRELLRKRALRAWRKRLKSAGKKPPTKERRELRRIYNDRYQAKLREKRRETERPAAA
jgi:hypothetical protein